MKYSLLYAILLLSACSYRPDPAELTTFMEDAAKAHAGDYALAPRADVAPALERAAARNREAAAKLAGSAAAPITNPQERYAPIIVTAGHALEGVWRIVMPHDIAAHSGGKGEFGGIEEEICRIAAAKDGFRARCVGADDFIGDREVTTKGDEIAWEAGTPPFYSARIAGRLDAPGRFRGTMALRIFGVVSFQDLPVLGQKLPLDSAGEPALQSVLRRELARDRDFAELGTLQSLAFADQITPYNGSAPRRARAVFDAEFEHDWRICAIDADSDSPSPRLDCR
jgi:hypothetical protein